MPPTWPDPPWLSHVLLESPWGAAVFLVALGFLLYWVGGQRGQLAVQRTGFAAALLAVGVVVLAMSVETDRETLLRQTREIVDAMRDPADLDRLIGLSTTDATMLSMPKATLVPVARAGVQQVRLVEVFIGRYDATVMGPLYGRSYLGVTGRLKASAGAAGLRGPGAGIMPGEMESPFKAQAVLHWVKEPDGVWRVNKVEQLHVNDHDAEPLVRSIVAR